MAVVVVGVDGSKQSIGALQAAAREARCRAARLHVVNAYEPLRAQSTPAAAAVVAADLGSTITSEAVLRNARQHDDEHRAEAQRHAGAQLRQLVSSSSVDLDGLEVEHSALADEHPSAALVRLSQGADLLVVGSRGHGGFTGLLLGSVSQQCVHHAACPVLVTR